MNKNPLTLSQIFGAIMRQKVKGLFAFLTVFVLVMAVFVVYPKSYGSEGKIHVQMTRTETNLSPVVSSDGQSRGISIQDTRETEIKSVEEVLKSHAVLEAVARKVGPDEILKSSLSDLLPSLSIPSFLKGESKLGDMSPEEYERLKRIELATKTLDKSLTVHNSKKTSVISVYMKANSPRLAQQIVDEIINEARNVHQKMHGVIGSSVFFADKIKEAESNLEKSMAELDQFRKDRQVLSVGSARFTLQEIIGTLEKDIVNTSVEVEQSQRQIDSLKKVMKKTPQKIVLEKKGVERKSGDDAATEVFRLESERERLIALYRPSHPQVRSIDSRITQMKTKRDRMPDERVESQITISSVYSDVKMQLVRAETQNIGAKAKLKAIQQRLASAREQAIEMNQSEIEANRLQRRIEDSRKDRNMYVDKGREALASLSLDKSNLSTLVVAQQPSFILKHASPRGALFLPIALILGTLAGLATAVFCERNHLSPSLNEVEVEQILEMPVLVTLPRVYSSRNMVN